MSWTSHHRDHDDDDYNYADEPVILNNNAAPACNSNTRHDQQHFFNDANNNRRDQPRASSQISRFSMPKQSKEEAFAVADTTLLLNNNDRSSGNFLANVVFSEKMHKSDVVSLAWHGCLLASGGADKSIRVHEVCSTSDSSGNTTTNGGANEKNIGHVNGLTTSVQLREMSSDINLLERSFSPINDAHRYHVNSVAFFPSDDAGGENGSILASCSTDGMLCLWSASTGVKLASARHPFKTQAPLRICTWSPCGTYIASAGDDEKVAVWKLTKTAATDAAIELELFTCFIGPNERTVTSLSFTPDSAMLISGTTAGASAGGDLRGWDMTITSIDNNSASSSSSRKASSSTTKELFVQREAHDLGVTCCDMSKRWLFTDDKEKQQQQRVALLATGGYDNVIRIWHVRCGSGSSGQKHHAPLSNTLSSSASSKKQLEATCSNSYNRSPHATASIITLHMQLTRHTAEVCDCRLSHDSAEQLLVSASNDRSLIVWSLRTGAPLAVVDGFARFVRCVCFSPDDEFIACGDGSGRISLFSITRTQSSSNEACVLMPPPTYDQAMKNSSSSSSSRNNKRSSVADITATTNGRVKSSSHGALTRLQSTPASSSTASNSFFDENDDDSNITPEHFLCPITHKIMTDPVVAADGYTYDRCAIEALFDAAATAPATTATATAGVVSPTTHKPLVHRVLVPNRTISTMIELFNKRRN